MTDVPLSELVELNPSTPSPRVGDLVSFVGMADVSESGHLIRAVTRPACPGYTPFVPDDVLFAKITPCMENGKGAHVRSLDTEIGQGSTEFHVLRARPGCSSRYIYHWTQTVRLRLAAEAMMTGSAGQRRVPVEFFKRFRVPAVPLEEQRRIAEILDTVDEAIRATERVIAKLELVCQGTMEERLSALRAPFHPLGELLERIDGGKSPDLPDLPPKAGEWGVLKVSAVQPDGLRSREAKVVRSPSEIRPHDEVVDGDVLITRANTSSLVGMCCLVDSPPRRLMLSDKTLRLVPRPGLLPGYLVAAIQSRTTRAQIEVHGTGTSGSMKNISQDEIRRIEIPLPSIDEQEAVLKARDLLDQAVRSHRTERSKLIQLRSGLAEVLLSGQVRTVAA